MNWLGQRHMDYSTSKFYKELLDFQIEKWVILRLNIESMVPTSCISIKYLRVVVNIEIEVLELKL